MKLLHLIGLHHYLFKLDRYRVLNLDDMTRRFGIDFYRSGPGWDNWNNDLTATENVINICGGIPDVVVAYNPNEIIGFDKMECLKVLVYNEMRAVKNEIIDAKPNLIVCHHLNERTPEVYSDAHWEYIPHIAPSNIFNCTTDFEDRDIDFLFFGFMKKQLYPLRYKLNKAILKLSRYYNCYFHPHPGYEFPNAFTNNHLFEASKILNRSKIVGTCSSVFKYRLSKYPEITACGSVLVADMPYVEDDEKNELKECSIIVDHDTSIDDLTEILINQIKNKDRLYDKHKLSIEYGSKYDNIFYSIKLFNVINRLLKGETIETL